MVTHDEVLQLRAKYRKQGLSEDYLDELVLALFDAVDLTPYIALTQGDYRFIGEIRRALRQGILTPESVTSFRNSEELRLVREASGEHDLSLSAVEEALVQTENLSDKARACVLRLVGKAPIGELDFSKIPDDLLEEFEEGLIRGLPVQTLNTGQKYSVERFRNLMFLLVRDINVKKFLFGGWGDEQISILADPEISEKVRKKLAVLITDKMAPDFVLALRKVLDAEIDVSQLAEVDIDGDPFYQAHHLEGVRVWVKAGLDYRKLLNPSLSAEEIREKTIAEKAGREIVRGRLRKQ